MAVKVFLKHLFTSIKRRPAQPFLLMLVLTLAVTVCIAAFDIETLLRENDAQKKLATDGTADFTVSVNSLSSMRFLLVSEAEEALPPEADCCGLYGLPMLYGAEHDFIYGAATDLNGFDGIFSVELTESAPVPANKKNACIFITQDFSDEYGVGMGSTVTFSVLGTDATFTVFGISEKKFMGAYSVLFDVKSVASVLSEQSVFMSYLGTDFRPAGTLYVKADGLDKKEVFSLLQSLYPDMTVTDIAESTDAAWDGINQVIPVVVVVSVLFVVMIIYCCFHILSAQRKEETELFSGIGAKPSLLYLLSSVEMFVYWAVGAVLGILLSLGVSAAFIAVGNLVYCTVRLHARSVLLALLLVFLASQFGLILNLFADWYKNNRRRKKKAVKEKKPFVLVAVLAVALIPLSVAVSFTGPTMLFVGIAALVVFGVMIFLLGKNAVPWISLLLEKKRAKDIHFLYAIKNAKRVTTLGNTTGLIALCLSVVFIVVTMISTAEVNLTVNETFLTGDYLVLNAGQNAKEALLKTNGVDHVYSVYKEYIQFVDRQLMMMATDDRNAYSQGFALDHLPEGDEIILTELLAEYYGIEIGDTVSITVGNKTITPVYRRGIQSNDALVLIDADYWGVPMNYYLIDGKDDCPKEQLYANIMSSLVGESATVIPKEEFTAEWIESIKAYVLCAELLVIFIMIFSVIGMADSIVASYRSRREEFLCFRAAGMNEQSLRKMKRMEILTSFSVGVLLFLVFAAFIYYLLDMTTNSLIMNIAWIWREYFGGIA